MCGVMQDIANLEKNFHKMFEGIHRLIIVYREHQMTLKQREDFEQRIEKEAEREEQTTKKEKKAL